LIREFLLAKMSLSRHFRHFGRLSLRVDTSGKCEAGRQGNKKVITSLPEMVMEKSVESRVSTNYLDIKNRPSDGQGFGQGRKKPPRGRVTSDEKGEACSLKF
jgi:hypothetical protein